eukprot:CAMPEP_0203681840 /NCGR_PEP_ID=MMETSP0090-20130426/43884_1 /ASSEMBLY_ACC=CAM_ASM_001088 /TAXON_ID=426623 /ORGANISM="Chaetoceros affinis, Strain CCMP159" /LENGTH=100 /DNA_ID=CAMNT_0050550487 /DNA_START=28 /DNA_END=326 /DNA_ORIENTATION=-
MRLAPGSLVAFISATTQSSSIIFTDAFSSSITPKAAVFQKRTWSSLQGSNSNVGSEFDYLLGEGMNINSKTQNALSSKISSTSSNSIDTKNIILLPDTSA